MRVVSRKKTGRFTVLVREIANGIVDEADERGCSHIAFEDLTDISKRMAGAKRGLTWAFRHLHTIVANKAEVRGAQVEQVNTAQTSQWCSTCGYPAATNRPSQARFPCL